MSHSSQEPTCVRARVQVLVHVFVLAPSSLCSFVSSIVFSSSSFLPLPLFLTTSSALLLFLPLFLFLTSSSCLSPPLSYFLFVFLLRAKSLVILLHTNSDPPCTIHGDPRHGLVAAQKNAGSASDVVATVADMPASFVSHWTFLVVVNHFLCCLLQHDARPFGSHPPSFVVLKFVLT